MNKQKVIGLVIGVFAFLIMIAGITYAFVSWQSENINKTVSSKCFEIFYDKKQQIFLSVFIAITHIVVKAFFHGFFYVKNTCLHMRENRRSPKLRRLGMFIFPSKASGLSPWPSGRRTDRRRFSGQHPGQHGIP